MNLCYWQKLIIIICPRADPKKCGPIQYKCTSRQSCVDVDIFDVRSFKFLMRTSFLFIKHWWISQHSDWRKLETIKSVRSAVDLSCSDSAVSRSPLSLISSWPAPYKRQDTLLLLSWYLKKHFDTFIELIPLKTRAQEVTMSVHLSPPNCHLILSLRW